MQQQTDAVNRHNPPELWFRGVESALVRRGVVTATVRIGKRDACDPKGYVVGDLVLIKFYERHHPDDRPVDIVWSRVVNVRITALETIQREDLSGCPEMESTLPALVVHLTRCYEREIAAREPLTIVHFSFSHEAGSGEEV
ncbi:MAG: hypothetical protein Q7S02_00025 [bacterium]|nr:hypothetical protein [bacterium]